jgi:Icc-related predicted phosphoesterase
LKIVVCSDTHEQEHKVILPEGDMLIHCGDWTYKGTSLAIEKFLNWFSIQPHKFKVFIAGNHELGLDTGPGREYKLNLIKSFTDKNENLFYLENSGVNIEGLNIYGSPVSPWFGSWAWSTKRGPNIQKYWEQIPTSTNILITHTPPHGILDLVEQNQENVHVGCVDLRTRIDTLPNLKLSCFGHLHKQGSIKTKLNNVMYVNGALCDEDYVINRIPVVVEI